MKVLIPFSSGVNSTYALHRWLTETDHDIVAIYALESWVGNNGDSPTPLPQRNSSKDWAALSATVAELKGHPAVLGWYLW